MKFQYTKKEIIISCFRATEFLSQDRYIEKNADIKRYYLQTVKTFLRKVTIYLFSNELEESRKCDFFEMIEFKGYFIFTFTDPDCYCYFILGIRFSKCYYLVQREPLLLHAKKSLTVR